MPALHFRVDENATYFYGCKHSVYTNRRHEKGALISKTRPSGGAFPC